MDSVETEEATKPGGGTETPIKPNFNPINTYFFKSTSQRFPLLHETKKSTLAEKLLDGSL